MLDIGSIFGYVLHHIHVALLMCMHLTMVLPEWVSRLVHVLVMVLSPSEMGDLVVEYSSAQRVIGNA